MLVKKLALSLLMSIGLAACSGNTYETVIRPDIIKVPVPILRDSASLVPTINQVWQYEAYNTRGTDTVLSVRVDTLRKKVYVEAKHDTITIVRMDTSMSVKPPDVIEWPLMSKVGFATIFYILGGVTGIILLIKKKISL